MTGDDLWRRGVRDQHNHGSGTFIGGDGIRIEMLDESTKQLLAKVTEQAPALGTLLEQALREGVISAETAASLSMAARAINEDVAASLRMASYSINEDVASTLSQASSAINAEPPRLCARLVSLEGSSPSCRTRDTRRSCVTGRCAWCSRPAISTRA
ncbi:hypothetical protein [Actinospica acidithermotolerans]|uniref:hypothetical protein n=1 Tax=Actinospica acidithermotolerans TaxID=2828514 RepID=UPI001BA54C86|nr:hypothetical protein [Actinospica acidithermotolerans]